MAGTRRLAELTEAIGARADFPRAPLILALSGGPDSAAMALLASSAADMARAVHVNHGTSHASHLEDAARAIAQTLDLELTTLDAGLDGAVFTEEAARDARYSALRSTQKEGEWIATGHSMDDQAETVLINLLRGTGLAGLAGIPSSTSERVARPLLGVTRGELRELAVLASLPFFDDPSNLDTGFTRNRVRQELIPMLEAGFNPKLTSALARTAASARADEDYLAELTGALPVVFDETGSAIASSVLKVASRPLSDRAIRHMVAVLRPPHPPTRAEMDRIWEVVNGTANRAQLQGGLTVELRSGLVRIRRGDDPERLR